MILGIGSDIVEIDRIEKIRQKYPLRFLEKVFHPIEQAYALAHHNPGARLATRFAAKEAVLKALGTGMRYQLKWRDIYIENDRLGKPVLQLTGAALEYVQTQLLPPGLQSYWHVSLSHSDTKAQAFVILEGRR